MPGILLSPWEPHKSRFTTANDPYILNCGSVINVVKRIIITNFLHNRQFMSLELLLISNTSGDVHVNELTKRHGSPWEAVS